MLPQAKPILERGRERLNECIAHCLECSKVCATFAVECLDNEGCSAEMIGCALLCFDCSEVCSTCAVMRVSEFADLMARVCAEVCEACAAACDKGGKTGCSADEARRKCADACRQCAESCRAEGLVTDSVPEFSRGGLRNPVSRSLH